jgi:predicted ATPase/DNA-binding SARP family transcriptional activator
MEFRILGPLEARADDLTLELGGARQRALLALLLLRANQVVSSERLIEGLWGEEPPETARSALRVHVAQLRKSLSHEVLLTRAPGYLLRVDPGKLDLERFRELVELAGRASRESRWEEAAGTLREALALWRGPPLAEFEYESWAQPEIARLEELRLSALSQRIDADLALGRHAELVGELGSLIAEYPLQEHLRGQLMLALYRSGRQAEALDVYQQTRRALVDELGIEPGQALQQLEQAMLRQDDELELPASAPAAAKPTGTVTLLFSDIEGSTKLLGRLGDGYPEALAAHRRLLREVFARNSGYEVDTQGDAFFVAFARATDAIEAAGAAQRALAAHEWPQGEQLRVRIGLHSGEPTRTDEGYAGLDLHWGRRIAEAGHGGQVLLSETTQSLLGGSAPLRDLGVHRLKDLGTPQRLYQLIVPGLQADFPPLRTLSVVRTNLPVQPTAFLGRERELAEVLALLARDEARLLTLTGPGGIGKTRLALQAAHQRADAYRDGVLFVALAPIRDPDQIATAVIQTIRLVLQAGVAPADQLRDYLAERELLLVLDNLEQFRAGVPLLAQLLGACPGLRLLAVSREPLRLAGEHEYQVPPLDESEAVQLFVDRAQAVTTDFRAGGEVAEICRRLDALPLAIELAAARVRALSPSEILSRLDKRLPLLTGGPRDAPERQRTLRAAIDWSHDLLSADEQQLFASLGIFTGGCTLAAAETVCEADLDRLQSLVEKSLVRHEDERYVMLETIREYGLERLEAASEGVRLRERHAAYFLELAERAAPEMRTAQKDRFWLATLEADRDNLRAALAWLIDRGDGERAQRLACALFSFWHDRGPVNEACEWYKRALVLPSSRPRRAAALSLGSLFACYFADYELGASWGAEGLSLAREAADHLSAMAALISLGSLAIADRRREDGIALFEEALALARDSGDEWAIGVSLVTILSHGAVDDPARAQAFGEEAARLRNVSASTRALIGTCLGLLAEQSGDYAAAASLYRESIAVAGEIGFELACASLLDLAWLMVRQGEFVEARARLSEGIALATEGGARGMAAGGVAILAMLAAVEGEPLRAATLAGAVETYRDTVAEVPFGEVRDGTFDHYLEEARASAGDEAWAEAFESGRAMSIEAAARYALEPTPVAAHR